MGCISGGWPVEVKEYKHQKLLFEGDIHVAAYTTLGGLTNAYQPYYHSEMEFHLVCQGSCRYFIGNVNYQLQSNSLAIIHKNEVHSYIGTSGLRSKKMSLIFSPKLLANRLAALEIVNNLNSTHYIKLSAKQAGMVELIIQEIAEECRLKEPYWQSIVKDSIEKFLIILSRAQLNTDEMPMEENPLIQDILGYLDETFAEKISQSDVADRFGLSSSSLSRMFKRYVGMGFQRYLMHRRIIEAKQMLENTDLKILSVATAVGFDDLSTFNRDFKLLTGISPSIYRKISL